MIGIDPHSVYYFGYPLFRALPDLTTEVNSFDHLSKNKSVEDVVLTLPTNGIGICSSTLKKAVESEDTKQH